jgi:hypothetical protein
MCERNRWQELLGTNAEVFAQLARQVAVADRISNPLAELNDLLTAANGSVWRVTRSTFWQ